MNRLRECSYALAFWAMRASVLAVVAFASSARVLVEVDGEQLGLHAEGVRSSRIRAAERRRSLVASLASCSPVFLDPAQEPLVLGRRPESEIVGKGRRRKQFGGTRYRPVDGAAARAEVLLVLIREDLVEVGPHPLGEQEANVAGVAPELAVCEGSHLERPERLHSLVGLSEESQPEHSQDDDEQGRAHERDEQLDVDAGRHAADSPDERVVGRAQQPAFRGTGCCVLMRDGLLRQVLRSSALTCCPRSS